MQPNRLLPLLTPALLTLLAVVLLWLKPARELSAILIILAYLCACAQLGWRRRQQRPTPSGDIIGVVYASQGGHAEQLAQRTVLQLQAAGLKAQAFALNQLSPPQLCGTWLFIVSTYGEGEAPDNGARFERLLQQSQANLSELNYAVLALGDSQYTHFCAFGERLDAALTARHAQRQFALLCVDQTDAAVLRQWQQQLAHISGHFDFQDWQPEPFEHWTLLERRCLNPDSQADKVYQLRFAIPADAHWQAGDLVDIAPRLAPQQVQAFLQQQGWPAQQPLGNGQSLFTHLSQHALTDVPQGSSLDTLLVQLKPLPVRQYSIASSQTSGHLELLVRQMYHPDGRLGLGSGWLCQHAELGSPLQLRLHRNPSFHAPADSTPMILIGNGTGLAGLRAHLQQRPPGSRNWLIFGERRRSTDFLYETELLDWLHSGHLSRLDLAFSQDQADKIYVQHRLRDAADEVRAWIAQGAALYLCGSLQGMGHEVHSLLQGILGPEALEQLQQQGRYRRDLY